MVFRADFWFLHSGIITPVGASGMLESAGDQIQVGRCQDKRPLLAVLYFLAPERFGLFLFCLLWASAPSE